MRRLEHLICGCALTVLVIGGCPAVEQRLINQGGGSVLSAVMKVASGAMSDVNPDELQILGDLISELNPAVDLYITDDQAQAGVDFVNANELDTLQDVFDLVEMSQENPGVVVIPESIQSIANSGVTLDDLIDISGGASARDNP